MPQLDVSTYASQLFWLAVCFSILYFTLKNKIIPQLNQLRQKRWDHTEGMQKKAESLQKEAEAFNVKWNNSLEEARRNSHEMVNQAIQKSRLNLSQKRSEFSNLIQRRLTISKGKIKKQEEKAQSQILEELIPLTTEAVRKISQGILPKNRIEKEAQKKLSSISTPPKVRQG